MMKQKIVQRQAQQQEAVEAQKTAAIEFETAEELLRHDAIHTPVPPGIARRLQESLDQTPSASQPWWRRFIS